MSRARRQAVRLPSSPPSPERLSLMITPSGAAAITYDLMTPAAIGRHSGGSRDCSCCPFSTRPPAGVNTASCSRLVCVPAKCQRAGTGLSSVSLLSALSGWPPPTRLCDLLITPRYSPRDNMEFNENIKRIIFFATDIPQPDGIDRSFALDDHINTTLF